VPAGVKPPLLAPPPLLVLPPPQALRPTSVTNASFSSITAADFLEIFIRLVGQRRNRKGANSARKRLCFFQRCQCCIAEEAPVTVTSSATRTLPPFGVTGDGAKAQEAPEGSPLQLNVIDWLNPPVGVIVGQKFRGRIARSFGDAKFRGRKFRGRIAQPPSEMPLREESVPDRGNSLTLKGRGGPPRSPKSVNTPFIGTYSRPAASRTPLPA
jgi:hypothetical protein